MALDKAVSALALKVAVVAGGATTITVPGIATDDRLIAVQESETGSADPTDRTSLSTISAANTVAISTSTSSDKLIVLYHDSSAQAIDAPAIKTFLGVGAGAATGFTVTGIATEDTLLGCFEILQNDAIWIDRTATSSITAADEVTSSSAFSNTTSDQALTIWHDASAQGIASISPVWIQVTGNASQSTATGVEVGDTLLMAISLTVTSNIAVDVLSTASITADDKIDWSSTTANDTILVLYHDASA